MIELSDDIETLARKIATARGVSLEDAVAWAIREGADRSGLGRQRRRMTSAQMLAVGDEIGALPLLDPRSPREIMQEINALWSWSTVPRSLPSSKRRAMRSGMRSKSRRQIACSSRR